MKITLKIKALFFTGLTLVLTVLGVSIATALLGREALSPDSNRLYGVPVGAFAVLITLAGMVAALVIALIWVDYQKHLSDETAHRLLEEQVARRTEQLLHANEKLQEMDRIKTELIHRVSHELRTPLTSIAGYSEVLLGRKAGPLNELQEDFVRTLSDNAARLENLVDGILEISRWEAGTQRIAWDDVSLSEVARQAVGAMQPVLEAKEQQCTMEDAPDAPTVRGDGAKLLQMMNNLLSNAIKYTPPRGRIHIRVLMDRNRVCIAVEDSGVGIPEEFLPRLFGKFERASNVEGPAYPGTGLGLYLVKQIVDAHQGTIRVESEIGRGTRITVSFPARYPDEAAPATTAAPHAPAAQR
jgi:two-component system, OmpR family, phosphate regulon sensor histidine kinase PhoR